MRDIVLTLFIFGSLPFIVRRPFYGILIWCWLSYMNPHRMTWNFAYAMPFAQFVAIATFAGFLLTSERKSIPWNPILPVWGAFVLWTCVTTFFALDQRLSNPELSLFLKVQLMTMVTMMAIHSRERLQQLIWVIVGSLAFFGVKGGIFTVMTGGSFQVLGPEKSFIQGNNELAFALIMVLPLMRFLHLQSRNRWVRYGLLFSMACFAFAIVGSQSRGAFVAGAAMCGAMFLRSRKKLLTGAVLVVLVTGILAFMPATWTERMWSIKEYKEDGSAMGRINAWMFAINLAADRPALGGGFDTFTPALFYKYAPDPLDFHDSHSIYFEVLAEHGYVGLLLFLTLGAAVLLQASTVIRRTRDREDLAWAGDLGRMVQVCLVGYAVGGAFLGLAYFDLYYHLLAIVLITHSIVLHQPDPRGVPVRAPNPFKSTRPASYTPASTDAG